MSDDAVRVYAAALRRAVVFTLTIFCAVAFGVSKPAHAQDIRLPVRSAGPQTLSGTVVDETGKPLADIDVFIEQLQRRTRSGASGKFQFDSVKAGKYTVGARSIGYEVARANLTVRDSGVVVQFRLKRTSFSLPSVVTTAARGGLTGTIADTGFRAMPGVRVRVLGQTVDLLTDSSGQFFAPLGPGAYLLRIEREGFHRQLIGVRVPKDSGRQVAAWMVPQKGKDNPQIGANLFDLNMNMLRGSPVSYSLFTQQDFANSPHKDLRGFLTAAEGRLIDPMCQVLINGGPVRDPLWTINPDDIEFMELNRWRPPRPGAGPPPKPVDFLKDNKVNLRNTSSTGQNCSRISVWLRQ